MGGGHYIKAQFSSDTNILHTDTHKKQMLDFIRDV